MSLSLQRDVVILACAVSAGVHAALAPDDFAAGAGAGLGFLAAAVVLGALAVALTRRPEADLLYGAAAVVLAGLISSYAAAVTIGVPVLHPEPEPISGLALTTKAIEALGAAVAVTVLRRHAASGLQPRTKGT